VSKNENKPFAGRGAGTRGGNRRRRPRQAGARHRGAGRESQALGRRGVRRASL